ncbi:MAG: TolC family protein [Candidatus Omnitrophota bacterium]
MMKAIKTLLIFVFTVGFVGVVLPRVYAQEDACEVLSLEDFIHSASINDKRFEEILIDKLKLKYKKALGLPADDLVISLKRQYNFVFDPKDTEEEDTISLSKLFPYTGTEIAAEYNSSFSRTTHEMTSDFEVTVSQPIAENAFGRNSRLLGKIIGVETDVANFQIIEAYEDYLASLVQLYYNWYSACENVRTARNSYNENVKLLENIKEREKYKIALPVDVNKVSLQVAIKKEALITLQNKYDEYLNMIKESIRYEGEEDLQPRTPSAYEDVEIDFEADYAKFSAESRTIEILKMLETKSAIEVNKYADELLPSIDIIAGYSLEGTGREIEDVNRLVYAGASLDWPFPGAVERAGYETSKIELNKTKLFAENIHCRLHTNLKNLNDQIIREKELIVTARNKIDYAQAIVDDDKKNYSLGRTTLNDLIDEVNKLEDNKFNKIFHEVQLKRLIVEWLRLTDTLLQKE